MFFELFGVFFVLIKLTIVPLAELIQQRFFSNKDRSVKSNEEQVVQLVRFVQLSADGVPKQ